MLFDDGVVEALVGALPTWAAALLLVVAFLGSVYVVGPLTAIAYLANDRLSWWPPVVLVGYGTFVAMKPVVSIPRPSAEAPLAREALPPVLTPLYDFGIGFSNAGFPSGHAVAVTILWGLFVVDGPVGTVRQRLVAAIAAISAVGISRVGLGLHYPGDVVGGILIGMVVLTIGLFVRFKCRDPVPVLLGMAALLAAASILVGREFEGLLLVGAVVAFGSVELGRRLWATCRITFDHSMVPSDQPRPLNTNDSDINSVGTSHTTVDND